MSRTSRPLSYTSSLVLHIRRPLSHTGRLVSRTSRPLSHTRSLISHTRRPLSHTRRLVSHTRRPLSRIGRLVSRTRRLLSCTSRLLSRTHRLVLHHQVSFIWVYATRVCLPTRLPPYLHSLLVLRLCEWLTPRGPFPHAVPFRSVSLVLFLFLHMLVSLPNPHRLVSPNSLPGLVS